MQKAAQRSYIPNWSIEHMIPAADEMVATAATPSRKDKPFPPPTDDDDDERRRAPADRQATCSNAYLRRISASTRLAFPGNNGVHHRTTTSSFLNLRKLHFRWSTTDCDVCSGFLFGSFSDTASSGILTANEVSGNLFSTRMSEIAEKSRLVGVGGLCILKSMESEEF